MPVLDFYRYIGCDIAYFGNYGLPEELRVKPPCRLVQSDVTLESETRPDGTTVNTTRSPWGTLTATFIKGHPIKHPVETIKDLRVLKKIWLHSRYEEAGAEAEDSYARLITALGDDGVYVYTFSPSPLQTLLEYDMGLVNAYALLADYPEEFSELLAIMHSRRIQEYEICARRMPCEAFMPVENTSTTMISPDIYEKYSLPHIRDLVDVMHRHDKKVILHMCGLIRDLLPLIKQTGADGINALCQQPIGNTPFETAMDVLGDDIIIWGGVVDDTLFHAPSFSRTRLEQYLSKIMMPRIRNANFLLWVPADGLETPVERFLIVKEWMEKFGTKC
ncbi:MAG: hypothetical protein KKE37_07770 [Verrucomicrobia bacterium]|nr:hypothetical protein [Verrucomicrobiota bacterium]MBU4289927.1 hypothetical protein [Verrucomicrobiota bacterium]MBU4429233.1 hypothetical protein [Verrucomicrobiota bacterium]MCG2680754.1 hypothetical protein [Kiritimatiellia bacterium]